MSKMITELSEMNYKDGGEALYKDTGSYRGIITDEETGKKYRVYGQDQLEDKGNAFGYGPRRDAVDIVEVEADGVTRKTNGLLIEAVHFHDFLYVRRDRFGDIAEEKWLKDWTDVYPEGEDNSRVVYELGGGLEKFGGLIKKIRSTKSTSKREALSKKDKFYGIYKALYQKNYAGLVKSLIKASQEICEKAKAKEATKEQIKSIHKDAEDER